MPDKLNPDLIRLKDMLNAIADIEDFLERSSWNDRMTVMAIAYEIAILGEAASKISDAFHEKHSYIPWADIIGMRHRIIHGYGKVSIDRLKEVVEHHIPELKNHILNMIKECK
jgi:uncharacterized protein with HEPN domain